MDPAKIPFKDFLIMYHFKDKNGGEFYYRMDKERDSLVNRKSYARYINSKMSDLVQDKRDKPHIKRLLKLINVDYS